MENTTKQYIEKIHQIESNGIPNSESLEIVEYSVLKVGLPFYADLADGRSMITSRVKQFYKKDTENDKLILPMEQYSGLEIKRDYDLMIVTGNSIYGIYTA